MNPGVTIRHSDAQTLNKSRTLGARHGGRNGGAPCASRRPSPLWRLRPCVRRRHNAGRTLRPPTFLHLFATEVAASYITADISGDALASLVGLSADIFFKYCSAVGLFALNSSALEVALPPRCEMETPPRFAFPPPRGTERSRPDRACARTPGAREGQPAHRRPLRLVDGRNGALRAPLYGARRRRRRRRQRR